jgi:hypothetical protein
MPLARSKSWKDRAVSEAVILNIRADIPQLKKDLMVPYPKSAFANDVFTRALGAINVLERDVELLRAKLSE